MPPSRPTSEPALSNLPVTVLRGVGPERAAQLARLQLGTVADLLLHRPRRYEDRRRLQPVAGVKLGEATTIQGKVVAMGLKRYRKGGKSVFELILDDGTGRLHCRWWNLPFMQQFFHQGDEVLAYGKVLSVRPRTMDHPETEVIDEGEEHLIHLNRIVPVYPLTEGLPQRWLRSLIHHVAEQYDARLAEVWPTMSVPDRAREVEEGAETKTTAPPFPRAKAPHPNPSDFVLSRAEAVRRLHFPSELEDAEKARQRLALDEIIELQVGIQARRERMRSHAQGWPCAGDNHLIKPFLARLGFGLTPSQTKVLREIRQDLRAGQPMRRLLQGDVGSGKTVVAACSALMALESGFQVALMAPTEILAEQHYQNFVRWLRPLGIEVHLRTGRGHEHESAPLPAQSSTPTARILDRPVSGQPKREDGGESGTDGRRILTIGTHALIEPSFSQDRLGLVIIDEQHRFGVTQREKLVRKGRYPHLLVMTATPIPRTLGLTLYGDLDLSVIDELPAGRRPVQTLVRRGLSLPKVWAFIRAHLAEGRQAYVVYPRIEEGGREGLKAVTKEYETLKDEFKPWQVGLLHGRLRAEEKERVMDGFRSNSIQVLLATPLIEVGVDVANATIMLIENAERFGLAQLHQLRGRIGRGEHRSYCILIAGAKTTPEANERLKILEQTSDGFQIAELDLKLRGPGELLGQQQSGLPPFRFADLTKDLDLVECARGWAAARRADETTRG